MILELCTPMKKWISDPPISDPPIVQMFHVHTWLCSNQHTARAIFALSIYPTFLCWSEGAEFTNCSRNVHLHPASTCTPFQHTDPYTSWSLSLLYRSSIRIKMPYIPSATCALSHSSTRNEVLLPWYWLLMVNILLLLLSQCIACYSGYILVLKDLGTALVSTSSGTPFG